MSDEPSTGESITVSVVWLTSGELVTSTVLPLSSSVAAVTHAVRAGGGPLEEYQQLLIGSEIVHDGALLQELGADAAVTLGLAVIQCEPWTLRLRGGEVPGELRKRFSVFGNILHIHSMKYSSETIVLFASRAVAEAAIAALTVHSNSISQPAAEKEPVKYGGYNGHYWPNLITLLDCAQGAVTDESLLAELRLEAEALRASDATQNAVAALLLRFVKLLPEDVVQNQEALSLWTTTMGMFAAHQLSQHCDRFADTSINELLGCMDMSKGTLEEAWAETE